MSLTTAFKFAEPFPFCVSDISGSPGSADYISNLTLTQVMDFYWNVESVTIDTVGTGTNGAASINATQASVMSPPSSTYFTQGSIDNGGWFPTFNTDELFVDWPPINEPYERVCYGTQASGIDGYVVRWTMNLGDGFNSLNISFILSQDPSNPGNYRLYYLFIIDYWGFSGADSALLRWANPAVGAGPYTPITTGTFTVNGLTFNYASYANSGTSTTGGTMSATSSAYSY